MSNCPKFSLWSNYYREVKSNSCRFDDWTRCFFFVIKVVHLCIALYNKTPFEMFYLSIFLELCLENLFISNNFSRRRSSYKCPSMIVKTTFEMFYLSIFLELYPKNLFILNNFRRRRFSYKCLSMIVWRALISPFVVSC